MIIFLTVLLLTSQLLLAFNLDTSRPIILKDPQNSDRSLFGYSIALLTVGEFESEAWVLIGAPRGSSNEDRLPIGYIDEPGVLYLCSLRDKLLSTSCAQVTLDPSGDIISYDGSYKDRKENSWVGVSLALSQSAEAQFIWMCGHRWANQIHNQSLYMNGVCYWKRVHDLFESSGRNKYWHKFIPLKDLDLQVIPFNGVNKYYYHSGQAGIAIHILKTGSEVVMGAPGILDWTGSVILASVDGVDPISRNWRQSTPLERVVSRPPETVNVDSYLGYSISSGVFWGDEMIVAGAPRSQDTFGQVMILRLPNFEGDIYRNQLPHPLVMLWSVTGYQMGAGFGSVVTAADVTADGKDEVFVSAPLFTKDGVSETGGVWVYTPHSKERRMVLFAILFGIEMTGRFGAAIASLGDLDQDGFQDTIIGAPLEDSGRGAVYIYRGGAKGIASYSQRIQAKDFDPSFKGFGSSFASNVDVSGDSYVDVAIGVPESASVVLLRGRRVIHLDSFIRLSPGSLSSPKECFNVSSCMSYHGKNTPLQIEMVTSVTLDTRTTSSERRAFFTVNSKPDISVSLSVKQKTTECVDLSACLREGIRTIVDPVHIETEISSEEFSADTSLCYNCQIISPQSKLTAKKELVVTPGCGQDNQCSPNLSLKTELIGLNDPYYVIGSGVLLTLRVVLQVSGEWAYQGWVQIDLPAVFLIKLFEYRCGLIETLNSTTTTTVFCSLNSPLKDGEVEILEVVLEEDPLESLSSDAEEEERAVVMVSVGALGAAKIATIIPIQLERKVKLSLFGVTEPDLLLLESDMNATTEFKFIFQVVNYGITPAREIKLNLWIPTDLEDHEIITFSVDYFNGQGDCHFPFGDHSNPPPTTKKPPEQYKSLDLIKCTGSGQISCRKVICFLDMMFGSREVILKGKLHVLSLKEARQEGDVALIVQATAEIEEEPLLKSQQSIEPSFLIIIPEGWIPQAAEEEHVPWWVYFLSVIGGLFLLAFLIATLFQCGFFKRDRPPAEEPVPVLEGESANSLINDSASVTTFLAEDEATSSQH